MLLKKTVNRLTVGGDHVTLRQRCTLVFRSAHFATYCIILSVNFKPLCIGPIMSASADKGDRKREIEQSPMKKKFRDSAISREDLDDAIANSIKLALKEQQSTLNSVVTSAVRDAVDSVLIPACANCVRTYKRLTIFLKSWEWSLRRKLPLRSRHVTGLIPFKQLRVRIGGQSRTKEISWSDSPRRWRILRIGAGGITYSWWGCQRGRRTPTQLVSSELIFPSGFLRWKAVTLRLTGHITCMMEGEAPISRVLSSSVTKMAWQIGDPERCSAGLSGEMRTVQCHTTIFSRL